MVLACREDEGLYFNTHKGGRHVKEQEFRVGPRRRDVATLWQKFEESIRRNHGAPDDLHLLAQPEGDTIIDTVAKQLVMVGAMQRNVYLVPVNYDLAHDAQIAEAEFNWVTDYYGKLIWKPPTEHLYPLPKGTVEQRITLVHLNRHAERPEIIAEMDKLNVRPVLSPEFLALTRAYPDLQLKFLLVGLASVWVASDGDRRVLYACESSGGRDLGLDWGDHEWHESCRFPAVCPTSPAGFAG